MTEATFDPIRKAAQAFDALLDSLERRYERRRAEFHKWPYDSTDPGKHEAYGRMEEARLISNAAIDLDRKSRR
jgi:hypothetical protein